MTVDRVQWVRAAMTGDRNAFDLLAAGVVATNAVSAAEEAFEAKYNLAGCP